MFGQCPTGMDVPKLYLPIRNMTPGMDFRQAMIEDSRMIITREELQAVFDDQVSKMFDLIDRQLRVVAETHPGEVVSFLVLSGGLGSSPYVRNSIKRRYERQGVGIPSAEGMKVPLANEPQLTVCHGLVSSRIQSRRGGPEMYSLRMSPVSFGIVCREIYDPVKHQGEDISEDRYDKRRWAEGQINVRIVSSQPVMVCRTTDNMSSVGHNSRTDRRSKHRSVSQISTQA